MTLLSIQSFNTPDSLCRKNTLLHFILPTNSKSLKVCEKRGLFVRFVCLDVLPPLRPSVRSSGRRLSISSPASTSRTRRFPLALFIFIVAFSRPAARALIALASSSDSSSEIDLDRADLTSVCDPNPGATTESHILTASHRDLVPLRDMPPAD